jgi:hypothetical protein
MESRAKNSKNRNKNKNKFYLFLNLGSMATPLYKSKRDRTFCHFTILSNGIIFENEKRDVFKVVSYLNLRTIDQEYSYGKYWLKIYDGERDYLCRYSKEVEEILKNAVKNFYGGPDLNDPSLHLPKKIEPKKKKKAIKKKKIMKKKENLPPNILSVPSKKKKSVVLKKTKKNKTPFD